jgi:hypothetical protein
MATISLGLYLLFPQFPFGTQVMRTPEQSIYIIVEKETHRHIITGARKADAAKVLL